MRDALILMAGLACVSTAWAVHPCKLQSFEDKYDCAWWPETAPNNDNATSNAAGGFAAPKPSHGFIDDQRGFDVDEKAAEQYIKNAVDLDADAIDGTDEAESPSSRPSPGATLPAQKAMPQTGPSTPASTIVATTTHTSAPSPAVSATLSPNAQAIDEAENAELSWWERYFEAFLKFILEAFRTVLLKLNGIFK